MRSTGKVTCNMAVMACCAFNFIMTPFFECLLEIGCTDTDSLSLFPSLYSRSLCVTCFVSYAVVWHKHGTTLAAYRKQIALHETHWPAGAVERKYRAAVRCVLVVACLVLTVPANVARLYILYTTSTGQQLLLLVFFAVMYAINISMCLLETWFVRLCYAVYWKFAGIYRDLIDIEEATTENGCLPCRKNPNVARSGPSCCVYGVRHEDVYYYSGRGRHRMRRQLVEVVEELRVRHRLTRDALTALNDVFAVPVGMTLCTLCIMTLFDLYYHMTSVKTSNYASLFVYTWLFQYSFRFFAIVKTAHATSKQALKSKEILTNISRHFLDENTKDELQVFLNQISSTTIEFTVYGLFTVNSRIIISALGASLTWLVFLLQSRMNTDSLY